VTLLAATSAPPAADPRLREASRALEAMLVKQIVTASGAFKGGDSPGSSIRADMFASTLADAVAQSGSLGLADQIMRSVTPGAAPPPAPAPGAWPERAVTEFRPTTSQAQAEARARTAEAVQLDELPVAGRVTSGYGVRIDPLTGAPSTHPGLDVGAPTGTPIRSPARGVVLSAGPKGGYGNAVEIDHGDGLVTLYGHASELLVSKGQTVEPGQEIATVGATGRATGPHLHFEVRVAGRPVDPAVALKKYGLRTEGSHGSGP
jgi:murein DD-endopeptidase MepM/ murein hydrolase activator NlpD